MTTEDLAYIAGIVDGEGCIAIYQTRGCKDSRYKAGHRGPSFVRSVKISGTYLPLLEHVKKTMHLGRIRQLAARPGQKTQYEWEIGSKTDIVNFLAQVLDFMLEKRQQAVIMLETCNGSMNEHDAMVELKRLKKVGKN